jgi:adenylate cyclase 3
MKIDGTMSTTADVNPSTTLPSTGIALPDDVLEKLYQSYSLKQRRSGLACFLAASILFDLWAILIPQGQSWESLGEKSHRSSCP